MPMVSRWLPTARGNNPPLALDQVHIMDGTQGLNRLAPKSVDLIFTDPPCNIGVDNGAGHNDGRAHANYLAWCDEWFTASARVLKDGGSNYLMHYPEI